NGLASSDTPIGVVRECQTCLVRQHRHDCVETGIETMDLIEMRLHDLASRERASADLIGELPGAKKADQSGTAIGSSSARRLVISASSICSPALAGMLRAKCTGGRNSVDTNPVADTSRPAMNTRCRP